MEVAPVAGTIVVGPDQDRQPRSSRQFRRIIIVTGKLAIAFVIGTIAIPALIVSALVASLVVSATGGTQLIRGVMRRFGR